MMCMARDSWLYVLSHSVLLPFLLGALVVVAVLVVLVLTLTEPRR